MYMNKLILEFNNNKKHSFKQALSVPAKSPQPGLGGMRYMASNFEEKTMETQKSF